MLGSVEIVHTTGIIKHYHMLASGPLNLFSTSQRPQSNVDIRDHKPDGAGAFRPVRPIYPEIGAGKASMKVVVFKYSA